MVEVTGMDDLAVLIVDHGEDLGLMVVALTPDAWHDLTGRIKAGHGA
jgi:hypothetical protein